MNPRQEFLLRAMAVRDELKRQAEAAAAYLSRGQPGQFRDVRADAVASLASLLVEFATEVLGDDGK